jgi:hypothetical protein
MFTLVSVLAIATALAAASVWICDDSNADELPSRRYYRRKVLSENRNKTVR